MFNGKYHKRLYHLFQGITFVFCLVLLLLIGYRSTVSIKSKYENSVRQSVASSNMLSEVTFANIHSAISVMLRDHTIRSWGRAERPADYYYDAYLVNKQLQKLTTQYSTVPFTPAVTRLKDEVFVLSPSGSLPKKEYFAQETDLSMAQAREAMTWLYEKSGDYLVPSYDESGALQNLYYFIRPPYDSGDLVYIIEIPRTSLIAVGEDQRFLLLRDSQVLACSHNLPELAGLFEEVSSCIQSLTEFPDNPLSPLSWKDSSIYLTGFSGLDWQIAYIYDTIQLSYLQILLYMVIPFCIMMAAALWLSRYLSNRLYHPIQEVMQEVDAGSLEPGEVDEFQLFKQNARTARQLSDDLQKIMERNAALVSQKFYRDLLLGLDVRKNPLYQSFPIDSLPWCVILFDFQESSREDMADDLFFIKNQLFAAAQESGNHPAVNITHNTCAILLQTARPAEARGLALVLSNAIPEEQVVKIAISSIREGILKLPECYQEAKRVLEYRYLFGSSEILTAEQVLRKESENYFYPIVTENRLIQGIAEGKASALDVFDNLIRENFLHRNLTPEALRSFIYILFSTISRIFSELKTSPEELLGHPVDYEGFYAHWSSPNIISDIRLLIQEIITAVDSLNSNADSQTLSRMQNYIFENYSSDIMLNDMADELGISAKYCSNLFKKLSDENFKTFLNRYRINQAKKFLDENPGKKISELCEEVGFNSSTTFIRVFGKFTGMTPGAYAGMVKDKKK
ncbi:MAG: helix-turn-helix domain-containing protein [Lachnospiraceae bacterium]|nr:helix-turn-helix domain-containing protein [Lachnospiraceae bacterium]